MTIFGIYKCNVELILLYSAILDKLYLRKEANAMSIVILKPNQCHIAYTKAAETFRYLYEKVIGKEIPIIEADDGISDIIAIGSDAVNEFLMREVLDLNMKSLGIRYGSDDYCIRSYRKDNRNVLILAGGRGRSTLYAVYDYFERFTDCHYFWDGDVISHMPCIRMEDIDIVASPRFEYRGLRYFAHRGLKRFQAEHWSFADWKQEIDWMVKKRLNFMMLRIGMDDVWQRAFPEDVPYPQGYYMATGADASGYNDRSDFWTLKYRGELRQQILEYARALDLMYPVDCGTMTHWYSRTPRAFLEKKKPGFLPQTSKTYSEETGKVFDFRIRENMDYYMRLTDTMVKEYDKTTGLFHTIGLGERTVYPDRKQNLNLKLVAYRRISEEIRKRYPDAKLLVASWDFFFCWKPEEVRELLKELDPEKTIIFDYTSEGYHADRNFTSWDVVGKFPWIYGLFHAYEPETGLCGSYDTADERLSIAARDPYCKGMILWPELSHSDPLLLEYLSQNAWSPLASSVEEIIEKLCRERYGAFSDTMCACWKGMLPLIKLGDWSKHKSNQWCYLASQMEEKCAEMKGYDWAQTIPEFLEAKDSVVQVMETLGQCPKAYGQLFFLRDAADMARTALCCILDYLISQLVKDMGNRERIKHLRVYYLEILNVMSDVLWLNSDCNLYDSLLQLQKAAPTNPDFEITLKRNVYNKYCAQPVCELNTHLYIPEAEMVFDWLQTAEHGSVPDFKETLQPIVKQFMDTPLSQMQRKQTGEPCSVFQNVAALVEKVTDYLD